jgi:hypothetical protein
MHPWRKDASCREHPEVNFFPGYGAHPDAIEAPRAICRECLVQCECADYAIAIGWGAVGIWGGSSGQERLRLRREHVH